MCATWAKRALTADESRVSCRSSPHLRFRLISALSRRPESPLVGTSSRRLRPACRRRTDCCTCGGAAANRTVAPTRAGSVGAGVSPPLVGAGVDPTHGPESGFSPETPEISRHKLESIANRLWLGNPYCAGLSWDARDPTFDLPCRRSRVRIPSAALRKACICRSFWHQQSDSASCVAGD